VPPKEHHPSGSGMLQRDVVPQAPPERRAAGSVPAAPRAHPGDSQEGIAGGVWEDL